MRRPRMQLSAMVWRPCCPGRSYGVNTLTISLSRKDCADAYRNMYKDHCHIFIALPKVFANLSPSRACSHSTTFLPLFITSLTKLHTRVTLLIPKKLHSRLKRLPKCPSFSFSDSHAMSQRC